ncbi:FAD binding domain-containing protein [Cetobacterium somerae]
MIKKYFIPETIEEAISLKNQHKETGKYLAGGTILNLSFNKKKYEVYIDLRKLSLDEIKKNEKGNLEIGACVTFQKLISSEIIPEQLKKAAMLMENRNIRNMATIGGNIVGGKTVGDLIPTLIVLEAMVKVYGEEKLVLVEEYILRKDERFIEKIIIEEKKLEKLYGVRVHSRTSDDLSLIGAAVTYNKDQEKIKDIRIAVGGVASTVIRLKDIEKELEGTILEKQLLIHLIRNYVEPLTDFRGSKEFKAYLAGELVAECFEIA